jgi:hypothetical protein
VSSSLVGWFPECFSASNGQSRTQLSSPGNRLCNKARSSPLHPSCSRSRLRARARRESERRAREAARARRRPRAALCAAPTGARAGLDSPTWQGTQKKPHKQVAHPLEQHEQRPDCQCAGGGGGPPLGEPTGVAIARLVRARGIGRGGGKAEFFGAVILLWVVSPGRDHADADLTRRRSFTSGRSWPRSRLPPRLVRRNARPRNSISPPTPPTPHPTTMATPAAPAAPAAPAPAAAKVPVDGAWTSSMLDVMDNPMTCLLGYCCPCEWTERRAGDRLGQLGRDARRAPDPEPGAPGAERAPLRPEEQLPPQPQIRLLGPYARDAPLTPPPPRPACRHPLRPDGREGPGRRLRHARPQVLPLWVHSAKSS